MRLYEIGEGEDECEDKSEVSRVDWYSSVVECSGRVQW